MMQSVTGFFRSRSTAIGLILAALCAITLAALIPQSFLTVPEAMEAWQTDHPLLGKWSGLLGLHHIYTHPLFALVLAGATIALASSTWQQCRTSWRRTFRPDNDLTGGVCFAVPTAPEELCRILAANGYWQQKPLTDGIRLIRHPWGHWGNALLHLGMVVTIAASLYIALTQQRGILQLAEGTVHKPGDPLQLEEHGLFARPLAVPDTLRIDRVRYSFWPSNDVRTVETTISFAPPAGTIETKTVAINSILRHGGFLFYQGVEFGHAFFVDITDQAGASRLFQLQIRHPEVPDRPSYNDFRNLLGDDTLIRAKYLVDAEQRSFSRVNPLLTLRLDRQGHELGRVSLQTGDEGTIGPYRLRLVAVAPWTQLIVVNLAGISLVFSGFFIICLGGILHYFTPPREVSLREGAGGGTVVCWRATKFAGMYQDEAVTLKTLMGYREMHE